MNTLRNKNKLFIVTLSALCAALATSCMELEKPTTTKRTKFINGTISIFPGEGTVSYAVQEFHDHFFTDSRLKSSNTDPVIATLVTSKTHPLSFPLVLAPAKYFYNLNDGSIAEFTQASREEDFDEYQFNLVCVKNETIPGKNFMEQYSNDMNKFYVEPLQVLVEDMEELAAAKLIKDVLTLPVLNPISGEIMMASMARQGEKGCSSEQAFVKTMTKEKTKPYGDSMYNLTMLRQTNQKKVSHKTTDSTEKQQRLAYHIFLEKNHKAAFAISNKKPFAQACETTRKRPKKCFLDLKTIPERAEKQFYSQRQITPDSPHGAECNLF